MGETKKLRGGRRPPRTWSNMSPLGKDWGISIWFPNFPQLWYSCWSYLSSYSCWYYWLFYLFSKFASIQRRRWTVKEKQILFLFDSFRCYASMIVVYPKLQRVGCKLFVIVLIPLRRWSCSVCFYPHCMIPYAVWST